MCCSAGVSRTLETDNTTHVDTLDRSKPFFPVLETPARNIRECPHQGSAFTNNFEEVNCEREREQAELYLVNVNVNVNIHVV